MVRGRGYSRGGGRGGSYRGSSSNYRGSSNRNNSFGGSSSYGGSRNNYGGSYNSSNSYDSRNKDRGSSSRHSDRHHDHKRTYRASSRDRSPDRKRSRHEDSRMSSSYSSSYHHRRNDSSRSRPSPPVGRSSSLSYRHRDDSSSHRHSGGESMGPPKNMAPRSSRTGGLSSRGGGSGSSRLRGSSRSIHLVRRRESTDMRFMKRQLLLARQRDRAKRIKIAKLTSSLRKRREILPRKPIRRVHRSSLKVDESKNGDDDSNDEDDRNDSKKSKDDGSNDEAPVKEIGSDDKEPITKKSKESKSEGREDDTVADGDKAAAGSDEKEHTDRDKGSPEKSVRKRTFIKLTCVHCRMKCLTFKEYSNHLFSRSHKLAMRRLALRQKAQLSNMRLQQRNAQRDIEESSKEETEDSKPQFCLLCRLNYRQPKAKHQLSESHKNMKKFLMPYCSYCHIAFKSPMVYETHRCSLEHIKRKARSTESHNSDTSDVEKEVDLNNFMTLDSVGEIDDNNMDDEKSESKTEGDEPKEKVNVGSDHVKKMESFYCDLCRIYFSIKDDEEASLKKHCAFRGHIKAFLRYKENQSLRAEAERIQRRQKDSTTTKEKKKESKEENKVKDKEVAENEEGGEDKLWEDVDKDLGDLLREVGPDGNEDDEEDGSVLDINVERYDRFKNTDGKKGVNGTAEEGDDDVQECSVEEVKTNEKPAKQKTKEKDSEAKISVVKEEKLIEVK